MSLSHLFHVWAVHFPTLLGGLKVSIYATGLGLLIGLPLGLLLALLSRAHLQGIRRGTVAFVELGRGAPTLVLLYFIYYGAPMVGLLPGSLASTVTALAFSAAVYSCEIFAAALAAVPKGQHEGAMAIGLTAWKRFRLVILPQAIRTAIPPTVNLSILIFQSSALAFAISLSELLARAYEIGTVTFDYFDILLLAGVMYAAVSIPVSYWANHLEKKLSEKL